MKPSATMLLPVLFFLLLPSAFAQSPQTNYTVHVDFVAVACSLDISQISLYDQSGQLLAATSSPYGVEIAITLQAHASSIQSIMAVAFGQATLSPYSSWSVSGTRTIAVGPGGDYWITIRLA